MATNEDLLFAELAVKRELLTPEQVDEILALQKKLREMGLTEAVADLAAKRGMISQKDAQTLLLRVSPRGGRQQIEGYRLVERLGRGGMGAVYKAYQLSMGRPVAIKVLKPSLTKSDQQTERLRREAQLVGKLRHPNIVQGLDFGVSNGFHYFAMEYVDGQSVRDLVESRGPLREEEALRIVAEVAKALEYAHREGVVHRDVKPGNILVGRDGSVLLADYGLAKGPLEDVELTHSGVTVGTPQYISPEQARGPSDVDIRTDLYSLGATFYHMVTGRPPYEGETLAHLIQQVLYEPYPAPMTIRKDLSEDVAFVIEKLMARKPRHRYQNPKELLRDLEAIERGRSVVPGDWHGDFESFHARRKIRRTVALVALLLVLATGAGWFLNWRASENDRRQREERAAAELTAMLSVAVSPDGYPDRIRQFREIVSRWPGTEAAEKIRETYLPSAEARLRHLRDWKRTQQEVVRLQKQGSFASALSELRRFIEAKEREGDGEAATALTEARGRLDDLEAARDEAVAAAWRGDLDALSGAAPRPALEDLRRRRARLADRMYEAGESRDELNRTYSVYVERLEHATEAIEERLAPVRRGLEAETPDFRSLTERLRTAEEALRGDTDLVRALEGLPPAWRESLRGEFGELSERIRRENVRALDELGRDVDRLVDPLGNYERATALLEELAARSVEDLAARTADRIRALEERLAGLVGDAEMAFVRNLPVFLRALGARNWPEAHFAKEELEAVLGRYQPSAWPHVLEGMNHVLVDARSVEEGFVAAVRDLNQFPDGLWIGGIEYRQLRQVTVSGRTISFVTSGGKRLEKNLAEVDLRSVFQHSKVRLDPRREAFLFAVLRLGELLVGDSPKRRKAEIEGHIRNVVAEVARAGAEDPGLTAFAERLLPFLGEVIREAEATLRLLEGSAKAIYDAVERNARLGNWEQVKADAERLLEGSLSETETVRQVRARLQELVQEANRNLPSAAIEMKMGGARTERIAGQTPDQRDFVVRVSFDMEDEAQLAAFRYTEGRVGVVEVTRPVLGPPPPDEPVTARRTRTEHVLVFRAPVSDASEWPKHHPLRLESPFVYSEPMAIEFRARWPAPMALFVSLAGTNLLVLSEAGGPEYGRGVIIWQSEDVENPDARAPNVEQHRSPWLAEHPEVLAGTARHHRYFQFLPDRWYRVRFEKDERVARLIVDGVFVLEEPIRPYGVKSEDIVIRTWTPAEIDELTLVGTVEPEWYRRVQRTVWGRTK